MKPKKFKLTLTLEKCILDKAKKEAENCNRSLSQFVNVILKHYLSSKDKRELYERED